MKDTKGTETLETPVVKRETFASLNDIKEPGIYVDTRSPRFFRATVEGTTVAGTNPKIRVNEDGLAMGASITNNGSDFTVAKVSSDPMLAKAQVQQLCKDLSLPLPV